jgi:hypothetical protein
MYQNMEDDSNKAEKELLYTIRSTHLIADSSYIIQ